MRSFMTLDKGTCLSRRLVALMLVRNRTGEERCLLVGLFQGKSLLTATAATLPEAARVPQWVCPHRASLMLCSGCWWIQHESH